jgi:thiamine pyrophosphate-dependent acetolactate synthase large subunit-like protein
MATDNAPPPQQQQATYHGGRLVARRLKAHGVSRLFTLSGGHLFSIYDGCRAEGIEIVDVRHEQTAAFAAEGWAKVTREVGVCALTAGPGVTNGMSAIASAQANHSPIVVLGGRAPAGRWGQGSLQEIDHVPFVRPLSKLAATAGSAAEIPELVEDAFAAALAPHGGPAFVDLPMDYVFMEAPEPEAGRRRDGGAAAERKGEEGEGFAATPSGRAGASRPRSAPEAAVEVAGRLLGSAERPVIMAGTDLYWGHGEVALRKLAEALRIPVFLNGLARGCVAADHELCFSRTRSRALKEADVALVIGVPMDFRLGFGGAFGEETKIVAIDVAEPQRRHPREPAVELYGSLSETLSDLRVAASERAAQAGGGSRPSDGWVAGLRAAESELRSGEQAQLRDASAPLHPLRVYGELAEVLDRDAIVIGDGGDFVSYAGRVVDSFEPGCWLDPGPFGCLGAGPGYALAAKLARPERQVVLLLGDGAFGFAGIEWDTLARHGVNVVGVIGNNGVWGLEKHPMEFLYGYSVAADLRPGTRYDQMVEALGCEGQLVERPEQLRGALEQALGAGRPALVNVLTDPSVAYPRRSNLA